MKTIELFRGKHAFLSNFYPAGVMFEGEFYVTAEHAYQAAKTDEPKLRRKIRFATTREAKALGRTVVLRPDWDNVKYDVMRKIVLRKFQFNLILQRKLLATGSAQLVEGNTWGDKVWGVCDGEGLNWLGKILMDVRSELRKDDEL